MSAARRVAAGALPGPRILIGWGSPPLGSVSAALSGIGFRPAAR